MLNVLQERKTKTNINTNNKLNALKKENQNYRTYLNTILLSMVDLKSCTYSLPPTCMNHKNRVNKLFLTKSEKECAKSTIKYASKTPTTTNQAMSTITIN